MEGPIPRVEVVDSIPAEGGAQAIRGRASQARWQSRESQQWPQWQFGGVGEAAKLRNSSLNDPDSIP